MYNNHQLANETSPIIAASTYEYALYLIAILNAFVQTVSTFFAVELISIYSIILKAQ